MLNSNALTTIERLASFMGITAPTEGTADYIRLESAINMSSTLVKNYLGRNIKKTTYTQELYDAEKSQVIVLKACPVISSSPFILERRTSNLNENDWETIDSEYYTVEYEAGIITFMSNIYTFRARQGYRVTYTAGFDFNNNTTFLGDTEGADIELACWLISQDIKNTGGRNMNIKSERIGDYSVTYADSNSSNPFSGNKVSGLIISNPQALAILDSYISGTEFGMGVLTPSQSV